MKVILQLKVLLGEIRQGVQQMHTKVIIGLRAYWVKTTLGIRYLKGYPMQEQELEHQFVQRNIINADHIS